MTKTRTSGSTFRKALLASASLVLTLWAPQMPFSPGGFLPAAHAQSSAGQGGQGGQGGGSASHGGNSTHAPGTSGSYMGQGGSVSGEHGHFGQGGSTGEESGEEGTSSDRQGPRFGGGENSRQPESGTQGGRPAWAKEGIPEVELGRLSVARAPAKVLDHAFSEVITNWATTSTTIITLSNGDQLTVAQLYSMSASEFATIVATEYSAVTRIDSPLENLSLLKNLLSTGTTALTGVTPASTDDLAAIFLGSASDKTIDISTDTVTAINTILGLPALTPEQTADIAAKAELVRDAILTGHGE